MDTAPTPAPRHRHFVILPLFLAVAGLTMTFAMEQSPEFAASTVLPALETLPNGLRITRAGESDVRIDGSNATLVSGSAVFTHAGRFTVATDTAQLSGFHGAFHATVSSNALTVAALTSPVVVTQGSMRMIVPIGMQWTLKKGTALEPLSSGSEAWSVSRSLSEVPAHFLREQYDATELPEGIALPDVRSTAPQKPSLSDAVLPTAHTHMMEEWQSAVIGAVRGAIEERDAQALRQLLEQIDLQDAYLDARGVDLLALAATLAPEQAELQMVLQERLIRDDSLWLLLSYHPLFQAVTWTFDRSDLPREERLVRLYLLPFAGLSGDGIPGIVIERTKLGFQEALTGMDDPLPLLRLLALSYVPLIDRLYDLGYPVRASELGDMLKQLLEPYAAKEQEIATLLTAVTTRLQQADAFTVPMDIAADTQMFQASSVSSIQSSSSSSSEVPALSPEEVKARAEKALHTVEAIFTVKTAIEPVSPTQAKVRGVLFASPSGDREVSFTLDVVAGTVSAIVIDGENDFPFEPRFDSYVKWVRK